jgi:hypothetical protein
VILKTINGHLTRHSEPRNQEPFYHEYGTVRIRNPAENCCQQLLFYKRNQTGSGFLSINGETNELKPTIHGRANQ